MNYRFYIETTSQNKQVKPLNFTERSFKFILNNKDGKYYYSIELDGDLVFIGEDYQFIKTLDEAGYGCNSMVLKIYRDFPTYSVLYYKGKVRLVDMKYDLDKCRISSNFKPLTAYDCIDTNADKEINVLEKTIAKNEINFLLGDLETFDAPVDYTLADGHDGSGNYPDYLNTAEPIFWTDGGDPPLLTGWRWYSIVETTQYFSSGGGSSSSTGVVKWVREVITIAAAATPPIGFILVQDLGATKKYARPVVLFNRVQTGPTYSTPGSIPQSVLTLEYKYTGLNDETTILKQALKFGDVVEAMLLDMCGSTVFASDFFQWNPITSAANNYVTGQPNNLTRLFLIQKSDAKKPNASEAATRGILKFGDLMKSMDTFFDSRYYFDSSNRFRIEHISSFTKVLDLDTTIIDNGKWVNGQRKFSYDVNNMPKRENYKCMEAANTDFIGKPIEYSDPCTMEKDEDHTAPVITTDIIHVLSNPEKISDEGWVLIACGEYDGKLYILQEDGILQSTALANNILSFAHLHRDFHKHNRVKKTGTMNGAATTFQTVRPTKKAVAVTVPLCDMTTFKPDQLVKGPLGEGQVAEATWKVKNETIEVVILLEKIDAVTTPTAIYAKLFIEDINYPADYSYSDWMNGTVTLSSRKVGKVIVRFYSDALGTIPISVTNLTVIIQWDVLIDGVLSGGSGPFNYVSNGFEQNVAFLPTTEYPLEHDWSSTGDALPPASYHYEGQFSLAASPNYTII
jgi:hypothetical protein